jgi:ATP adenylyltransferase
MPEPLWAPWRLEYIEREDAGGRCVFCDPEDELVLHRGKSAFVLLNRYPYTSGHALVTPYRHLGSLAELDDAEALEIHRLATLTVAALVDEYGAEGHNLGWNLGRVAGAGITDHLHLHVVPRWWGDTNFMPVLADLRVIPEALASSAARLRKRFGQASG